MTARGTYIGKNKFRKVDRENKKIKEIIDEERDNLIRPTAAFVIFEEEEGAAQALKFVAKNEDHQAMGMPMKFTQASEPTDIIWENRHFYPGFDSEIFCCRTDWRESRVCREILGYTFVIIALCASFFLILYLASLEKKFGNVFPSRDCNAIE